MEKLNQSIENHYLKEELYEDIVNRLKEQDIDLNRPLSTLQRISAKIFKDRSHLLNIVIIR